MAARKGVSRPKRKASASSGPKRTRKVAAKDGKTPQELAREILIKNGLLPTANREVRSTTPMKEKCGAAVISRSSETLTKEQRELVEKRRRAALERRQPPSSSPGELTKEQRERIEKRRQEALKKRRQTLQSAGVISAGPTVADLASHVGSNRQQSRSWIEPSSTLQQRSRVVTPENLPTANSTAEARSEFFWDDLEAAAEIVQWENERMAKVALVRPSANTYNQELGTTEYQQIQQGRAEAQRPAVSTIPSLSQELAAAADIIEWEKKHEVSPEKSGIQTFNESPCSESEAQAPQFQLLPVHITDDFENHEPNANLNSNPKLTSHRKRQEPSPDLPHSNPGGENQRNSTPSHQSETHPDPAALLEKHIRGVEDKLELPVLEFLDMMLA